VPFKRPCPSFRDRAFGAFPPLFRPPRKAFGTSAGAPDGPMEDRAMSVVSSGEEREFSLSKCSSLFMHLVRA